MYAGCYNSMLRRQRACLKKLKYISTSVTSLSALRAIQMPKNIVVCREAYIYSMESCSNLGPINIYCFLDVHCISQRSEIISNRSKHLLI